MNVLIRMAAVSLVLSGLTACVGAPTKPVVKEERVPSGYSERDVKYMAQVERIARRRGIEVLWINPPNRNNRAVASSNE